MSNIISLSTKKIINGLYQEVYDARTHHNKLQSKKQFSDWIKNRHKDFIEGVDFISFTPDSEKTQGGRPTTEYTLTIDTAKQLALMERTKVGTRIWEKAGRFVFFRSDKIPHRVSKVIKGKRYVLSFGIAI